MAVASLHNIAKSYDGIPVLTGITTEFPETAITAIIGRSGSGKSTLLRTVNGLVAPDSGQVRVFGELVDYAALPALRRRIGYAVQGSGLFPHLTVADNITLLAQLEGWESARIEERLSHLMELVQLEEELIDRYPHELSGGQQQRVGLSRAMMLNPRLLLLDEPFAALDPLTRLDIHAQLMRLQDAEPRGILLVTHDMREALALADRILVMDAGTIRIVTTSAELRAQRPDVEPEQLLLDLLEENR